MNMILRFAKTISIAFLVVFSCWFFPTIIGIVSKRFLLFFKYQHPVEVYPLGVIVCLGMFAFLLILFAIYASVESMEEE